MKILIKIIRIEKKDGTIKIYRFSEDCSIVSAEPSLSVLLKAVFGLNKNEIAEEVERFTAEVFAERLFCVEGELSLENKSYRIEVYDIQSGRLCTEDYFRIVRSSEEIDSFSFFSADENENYPDRLYRYKNALDFYPNGRFARLTNGYGSTRSFRGFLWQYLHSFKPVMLRDDKPIFLKADKNGRFFAVSENDERVELSESDKLLFHYHAFLSVADFWSRADRIRNMHRSNLPLVVNGLAERLDPSLDLKKTFKRAKKIGRQLIVIVQKQYCCTKNGSLHLL